MDLLQGATSISFLNCAFYILQSIDSMFQAPAS